MGGKRSKPAPAARSRDEVITLARYGEITPEEAEAEAKAHGWQPFERQPTLPDYDPMMESRWSIVMTVAWIAWRDLQLVREQGAGFRSESSMWSFREWNQPKGDHFVKRAGWFLETWSEPTTARLSLLENLLKARDELPPTAQLPVKEAEQVLWSALQEGHLTAEALDTSSKPVEVPEREWSYLELFEDGKRDVLKYDALDRTEPYRELKLKRADVMRVWPIVSISRYAPTALSEAIDPTMFEPVARPSTDGYVPLCSALHWIMTHSGVRQVRLDDQEAWQTAVEQLFALIQSEKIQLLGLPRAGGLAEKIPGHTLALVKVLPPLSTPIEYLVPNGPSHISCYVFIDSEHWERDFNDQLYVKGQPNAAWTHLQLLKSQVLAQWPRPSPKALPQKACHEWLLAQMNASRSLRPKSKDEFWTEAKAKFRLLTKGQFKRAWDNAVSASGAAAWAQAGRPSKKSNRQGD